jgi:signal transduction histidine kinase
MTVRVRTTVAATIVVGVALATAAYGLVVLQRHTLVEHLDEVADLRATGVAALAEEGTLPPVLEAGGDDDELVRVVDANGRIRAESPGFTDDLTDVPRPTGGEAVVTSVDDVRVTTLRTADGFVFVATSLEPVDDAIDALKQALLIGAPALLLLVAAMTWLVVARSLRPVDEIRRQVAEISSRSLDRRVPVPAGDDEIGRLASTMNSMLGRLEDSAARQRRFVADASHELQTPLASSRTDLEVALRRPVTSDWPETAAAVLAANERMERLVRDLLFLARTDEAAPAPMRPVDLDVVVLEEVARLRGTVDVARVSAAAVLGRRDDLARVVSNLVDNALRHASSTVTVALAADTDVVLTVADDGGGVAPEDRERIFERFTRVDVARTRTTGGTGLGLAIAREIVEAHAGTIHVEDAEPGARFVVRLPSA